MVAAQPSAGGVSYVKGNNRRAYSALALLIVLVVMGVLLALGVRGVDDGRPRPRRRFVGDPSGVGGIVRRADGLARLGPQSSSALRPERSAFELRATPLEAGERLLGPKAAHRASPVSADVRAATFGHLSLAAFATA